jgi:3-hydroxybutyrate dehydrogenase
MRMKGRVALVTGAASGIGRAIAEAFAGEGAQVGVADIDAAGAQRVSEAIAKAGGSAFGIAMDVTSEDQVEQGVEALVSRFGGVDVLVSNAGVQHIAALVDCSFEAWRRLLAIHLDGAFLTTRACMRRMVAARKGGCLLYMGSVHSLEASPLKAPYVAAKHGILGLARAVAKEGAKDGIWSNVIAPGFVRTPLVERQIPEQGRDLGISEAEVVRTVMLKNTVDGEFTTLEDVAQLAVFLASFPSKALTGQSVVVSHGWHMQ